MKSKGFGLLRILLVASFACYSLVLAYLLFLWRGGYGTDLTLWEYIRYFTNIVPFRTIGSYVRALRNYGMNMEIPAINLLGNLLMFLPMGLYLPCFFKRLRKLGAFCISMVVLIFIIESAQLLLRLGSFDIDDFILNMAGALIGFAVWRGMNKAWQKRIAARVSQTE